MNDENQIPPALDPDVASEAPGEHPLHPDEAPGTTLPVSTYEMVVVAAREARRINDRLRRLANERETEKVTTRATERVRAGQVRFAYEDDAGS